MKILLLSWYFPPCNTIGALRIGKLMKYLLAQGHDVRVVCARDQPYDMTQAVEAPAERIHYTPWLDINGFPKLVQKVRVALGLARGRARPGTTGTGDGVAPATAGAGGEGTGRPGILRRLRMAYTGLLNCPDPQIGWLPYALGEGARVLRAWRADVIFASAPPHTVLLAASRLSRKFAIPWVAEYRDRWIEDPYGSPSAWRYRRDRWLENRTLRSAAAIVTVSEPWAEDYRRRWDKPVSVVYNGFDPDDYPLDAARAPGNPDLLTIVYTGFLYANRRDPSPLFAAIAQLGEAARHVRVDFYGADPTTLRAMATRCGVMKRIGIHDRVPYREAVRLQMDADVLLLLQWNDPKEQGNVPGKLFEYIAARRPVLGLGIEDGVPARLLAERGAGIVINDPASIAERLRGWIDEKRTKGAIPLLPASVRDGLSRPEQFAGIEPLLASILCASGK